MRETGFDIAVASEVMAILALAENIHDMRRRLGRMVVGFNKDGKAVTAEEIKVAGAMTAILRDAIKPNILQTIGGSLAFVHAETSTGVESDAEELCRLAREYGALAIVDAVTSLGGIPVRVDAWGADAVYSGSQKCLSAPPGLSPVTFSERAVEVIKSRRTPVQSWFLDLGLVMGYWQGGAARAYHHTAPINMLYALHEALLGLKEEGLEAAFARHRANHERLRDGLAAIGLDLLVAENVRLPQLNAVRVPEGVDEAAVRRRLLQDFSIEIGAGLGELAGRIWRIGLMGAGSTPQNVDRVVGALGECLGRKVA